MFPFTTIKSAGLAHQSYLLGSDGVAAVIDPRRDCRVYQEIAQREGCRITHIFETHRNEDYLIGSRDLARLTGATIYHGSQLPFTYGLGVDDGDCFPLGGLRLRVLHTPGHTLEHIAISVAEGGDRTSPFAVFTGDALFVNDVGRTDLLRDKELAAAMLYDSLFEKLLPLGDEVMVYSAHGAGSACGLHMSEREVSTIGYERRHNPALQRATREEFVRAKLAEKQEYPPYFERMEEYNLHGAPALAALPSPCPAQPATVAQAIKDEMVVVIDVRRPEAYGGAHIPGSLSIPREMLARFAGWFVPYDHALGLIVDDTAQVEQAVRDLVRIGYDRVEMFLDMRSWATAGLPYAATEQIDIETLLAWQQRKEDFTLLDVRSEHEYQAGHLPDAVHIYVGDLPNRLYELTGRADRPIVTFCSTGYRANIAASLLQQAQFAHVYNSLGSMEACQAISCPIEREEQTDT